MADKETDLKLTVGAVADEKSAGQVVKDITKKIDSSLKDGRIEIPVELKAPIKGASDDLIKAQKDVIKKWEAASKTGFSSSSKEADALIDSYTKFKRLVGLSHKNNQTQVKDLDRIIAKQVQSLKVAKSTKQIEVKPRKSTARRDRYNPDFGKHSKQEIDANIKNEQYRGTKLTGPKGFKRNSGFDKGVATSRTVMATEYGGSYEIKGATQAAKSRKEAEKASAKTLKTMVNKDLANALADAAEKNGGNKNRLTEQQKALEKANLAANEAAKHLGGLEHGRPDSTKKEYDTFIGAVSSYIKQAGKSDWDTMNLNTNKTMHRYHNNDGTLGVGDGTIKGEGKNHAEANEALKGTMQTYKNIMQNGDALAAEEARVRKVLASLKDWRALDALNRGGLSAISKSSKKKTGATDNSKLINEIKTMQTSLSNATNGISNVAGAVGRTTKAVADTTNATQKGTKATETQTAYDKIEHSAERVADSAEGKKNQTLIEKAQEDLSSGFNTDSKADQAIEAFSSFQNLKEMMCPCETVLQSILAEIQSITKNGININDRKSGQTRTKTKTETGLIQSTATKALVPIQESIQKALVPVAGTFKSYYEGKDIYNDQKLQRLLQQDRERSGVGGISRSTISTTVKDPHSWTTKLKDAFADLTKTTANYKVIMAKTSEEQDKMSAERISKFGLNKGRFPAENGDKLNFARSMSLWRGKDKFKDLFKDINLSEGVEVDTTAITDKLAKALSGAEMFKAQTGGWKNNLTAAATGGLAFAWQPSLEKTRAQADGLNQIMANIREAANNILQDIQSKESTLSGMKASGDLKFKIDGSVDLENSTNEAKALVMALEESKQVLASILGDVGAVDQVVGRTHGKLGKIVKQLGFTSPVLRQNNAILANLNAGLDKTGKALKFHTRMGEILNYSFQLMGRHIGQMFKNLLMMLNPINLLKKAFSDFASYDVKWQRTMNVIKYNLRRILRPFMEWLAQQLVNVLGIINAIIKGIGQAFGKDWDLFDQTAANAEKTREEFEKINNVTASFDELHDISQDSGNNTAENDLTGDIYKPQWGDLYETITQKAKAITEKLIPIFKKLGDILKWCLDHWQLLVAAWAAFKIAKALWNLLDWAGALKKAFKALDFTKFANLISTLAIIAGIIWGIKTMWETIKWGEDYYAKNPDERREQADKNVKNGEISGALIGGGIGAKLGSTLGPAGTLAGAAIGALIGDGMGEAAIATFQNVFAIWHGDSSEIKHNSEKAGQGIGKTIGTVAGTSVGIWASAKIGAAVGTTFGPVGTAVGAVLGAAIGWAAGGAIGKGLGSMFGDMVTGIQKITRGKGEFQRLKVSLDDVEDSVANVNDKTKAYNEALTKLQSLEKQTGESGKKLYDAVESGATSYDNLNASQKKLYDQYKLVYQAELNLFEAKKQNLEVSAKYQEQVGKESGDFKDYIKTMQTGMNDGIISQKDMYDHFAQTYGSLDADAKKVFVEQLPAYMRASIKDQAAEYETFGNKVAKTFSDMGKRIADNNKSIATSIKKGWETGGVIGALKGTFEGIDTVFAKSSNNLKILGATEDDVKASTEALATAQETENKLQQEVDSLQQKTKSSAEELYTKLNEGKITYQDLTADQQLLVNKYAELKEAMIKTDEAAKKNVENIASVDLQTATTSGNYDTFISNLMAANERGEISTDEMYTLMSQAYASMDRSARESFESQARENGIMVETVRTKSGEYLGIIGNLKKDVGNAWTDIKNGIKDKVKDFTTDAKTKFENLKEEAGKKWEAIKTTAAQKWEDIKNSAIGQKVQEIWKNATDKFEDLKGKLADKWEAIKKGASQGWENIVKAITGWVESLWKSITGIFENIGKIASDTWEKVKNFFSGKGFKTNEQVESDGNRTISIQPYAVGTNYVPSDGLAYLHKGEAVIPAKYNRPYQQTGNIKLEESINQLNKQVAQIGEVVNQGIRIQGQFIQRGTDLVASVEKTNNKISNAILNNKVYAR